MPGRPSARRPSAGCNAIQPSYGEGLLLSSPCLLRSRHTYCPYKQKVLLQGRLALHGLHELNPRMGDRSDVVVWFACTRSMGYGNGIMCSLVQRCGGSGRVLCSGRTTEPHRV